MVDLKAVYQAANLETAEKALDELEARWGEYYPIVIKSWRSKWAHLSAYFKYPDIEIDLTAICEMRLNSLSLVMGFGGVDFLQYYIPYY